VLCRKKNSPSRREKFSLALELLARHPGCGLKRANS
jgi:hypothetical protein